MAIFSIILFFLLLIAFIFWWFKRLYQTRKKITIPQPLPHEGYAIPFNTSRFGISLMFNKEGNSLFANMKLFENHFTFRVLNNYIYEYSDVQEVDYRDGYSGLSILIITFNKTNKKFYGYLYKYNLELLLKFFLNKDCKLTEKAQNFISQNQ